MIRIPALIAAALSAGIIVAGCSSNNSSESSKTVKALTVSDLTELNGGKAPVIEYYHNEKRIMQIDGKLSNTQIHRNSDAVDVLCELADIIGCSDPENELKLKVVNTGNPGFIYVFDQYYKDIPVRDGSVAISVDSEGNTTRLLNRFVDGINVETKPKLSAEEASGKAKEKYSCELRDEPELLIISSDRGVSLVWDIKLKRGNYPDETFLDANSGYVVAEDGPIPD
jgi:Zn-dependent metalloprotease